MNRAAARFLNLLWAAPLGLLGILLMLESQSAFSQSTKPMTELQPEINQSIYQYLESLHNDRYPEVEVDISPLDSRIKLAECSQPLTIAHRPNNRDSGRLTMKVSCEGADQWSIHVAVRVKIFDRVVVARSPIAMGTTLTNADLLIELKDVSLLYQGYFNDVETIEGFVTKRPIQSGQVLNATLVDPAKLVERGEKVVIIAEKDGLTIRTTGVAMDDGAYGALIRVKNTKSDRIVEGRITGPGQIKVAL